MAARGPLLLLVALLSVQSAARADDAVAAKFTSGSLVLLPVRLNGQGPYDFVLDTAATTTTLDDSVATRHGLRETGTMQVVTSGGTFTTAVRLLDELRIGTVRVASLPVISMPLTELRRGDRRVAGIIGQDVLKGHTLTVDYGLRRVQLAHHSCGQDGEAVEIAWADGRPMVSATLRGPGLPGSARLVLDSAANAMMLFTSRRATGHVTTVGTHQSTVAADALPRVTVDVGGARGAGPAVLLPPSAAREEMGLLPAAWFTRVCIDGPRSRATFAQPGL